MAIVPGIWKVIGREPEWLTLSLSLASRNHTMRVLAAELPGAGAGGVPTTGPAEFTLRRAAGTLHFAGWFDRGVLGTAGFEADSAFTDELRRLGLRPSDASLLHAAVIGLSIDSAREFKTDFPEIDFESLLSGVAFGATPAYARSIRSIFRVSTFDEVLPLVLYGVTVEFARAMSVLLEPPLSARDLASLRMAEVDPEYVSAMLEVLAAKPDARQVHALKRLHITPEAARDLAARARRRVSFDELSTTAPPDLTPGSVTAPS